MDLSPEQPGAECVDVLTMKARSLKVKLKTNQTVTGVSFTDGQWKIHTDGWTYNGDAVILANVPAPLPLQVPVKVDTKSQKVSDII